MMRFARLRIAAVAAVCLAAASFSPALAGDSFESILQGVRESAKARGQTRIYIHGEKEAEKRADSIMNGIALDDATWKMFDDYAAKFGLHAMES